MWYTRCGVDHILHSEHASSTECIRTTCGLFTDVTTTFTASTITTSASDERTSHYTPVFNGYLCEISPPPVPFEFSPHKKS